MQLSTFIRPLRYVFGKLFQKRSIIIITEKETSHFSLSARAQLASMALVAATVFSASYFAGSYMSARTVIAQKEETLKHVANSRVENNFQFVSPSLQAQNIAPVMGTNLQPLNDSLFSFEGVGQDKLYARIALLESRVKELNSANEEIISAVREKTNGKIADLEEVIRKTGLDPKLLQKQATKPPRPQGGPFIPGDVTRDLSSLPTELDTSLSRLMVLNNIIETLPLASPLPNGETQSLFGRRIDPFTGRLAMHSGIDLSGPAGAKVQAANSGKVVEAGYNGAYGNMIDIDHGFGLVTRYGHLSQIKVKEGDRVKKGQVIGVQGSTGRSTGAHLHYEVRHNDRTLNPANFLKAGMYVSKN